MTDETHDPALTSWVESAERAGTDFPIQNLPFGVFRHPDRDEMPRVGVAIGDCILDVTAARHAELLGGLAARAAEACDAPALNELLALVSTVADGAWVDKGDPARNAHTLRPRPWTAPATSMSPARRCAPAITPATASRATSS